MARQNKSGASLCQRRPCYSIRHNPKTIAAPNMRPLWRRNRTLAACLSAGVAIRIPMAAPSISKTATPIIAQTYPRYMGNDKAASPQFLQ